MDERSNGQTHVAMKILQSAYILVKLCNISCCMHFLLNAFCVFNWCSNSSAMGSSVKDDVYDFLFKGEYSTHCIHADYCSYHISLDGSSSSISKIAADPRLVFEAWGMIHRHCLKIIRCLKMVLNSDVNSWEISFPSLNRPVLGFDLD